MQYCSFTLTIPKIMIFDKLKILIKAIQLYHIYSTVFKINIIYNVIL